MARGDIDPDENEMKPYQYSAMFQLKGKDDPLVVQLTANGSCPRIKLDKTILNFGECPVNDYRDIQV